MDKTLAGSNSPVLKVVRVQQVRKEAQGEGKAKSVGLIQHVSSGEQKQLIPELGGSLDSLRICVRVSWFDSPRKRLEASVQTNYLECDGSYQAHDPCK